MVPSEWQQVWVLICITFTTHLEGPGAVVKTVERRSRVREIGSSVPDRFKPVTYQIDRYRFLAWYSTLIGWGKDRLAQCQVNVT